MIRGRIETTVDTTIREFEEYTKKRKEWLITEVNNSSANWRTSVKAPQKINKKEKKQQENKVFGQLMMY